MRRIWDVALTGWLVIGFAGGKENFLDRRAVAPVGFGDGEAIAFFPPVPAAVVAHIRTAHGTEPDLGGAAGFPSGLRAFPVFQAETVPPSTSAIVAGRWP